MQSGERRRHHTAPSRLKKREVPAVWDLFALDDRANGPHEDDDDASSVASLSSNRAPSIASFASEETQTSASNMPNVERGGSWPRDPAMHGRTERSVSKCRIHPI